MAALLTNLRKHITPVIPDEQGRDKCTLISPVMIEFLVMYVIQRGCA